MPKTSWNTFLRLSTASSPCFIPSLNEVIASPILVTKSIAPSTISPNQVTTLVAIGSMYAPTVSVNSVILDWVLLIWFA